MFELRVEGFGFRAWRVRTCVREKDVGSLALIWYLGWILPPLSSS